MTMGIETAVLRATSSGSPSETTWRPRTNRGAAGRPIALVVIVALGVVLRAWRLGFNGLSYDESFTAMAARLPIDHLFDYCGRRTPTRRWTTCCECRSHAPAPSRRCGLRRRRSCARSARWCSSRGGCAPAVSPASWRPRCSQSVRSRSTTVVRRACTRSSNCSASHRPCSRSVGSATRRRDGVHGPPAGSSRWRSSTTCRASSSPRACSRSRACAPTGGRGSGAPASGVRSSCGRWCGGPRSHTRSAGTGPVGSRTSPSSFARAVSGQLTNVKPLVWVVLVAVLVGGWCLWRADRRPARVGRPRRRPVRRRRGHRARVTVPHRPSSHGCFVGAARRGRLRRRCPRAARWSPPGRTVVFVLLVVVAIGTVTALGERDDADFPIDHLEAVAHPGDTILTRPARHSTLPGLPDRRRAVAGHPTGRNAGHRQRVRVPSRPDPAHRAHLAVHTEVVRAGLPGLPGVSGDRARWDRAVDRRPHARRLPGAISLDEHSFDPGAARVQCLRWRPRPATRS